MCKKVEKYNESRLNIMSTYLPLYVSSSSLDLALLGRNATMDWPAGCIADTALKIEIANLMFKWCQNVKEPCTKLFC